MIVTQLRCNHDVHDAPFYKALSRTARLSLWIDCLPYLTLLIYHRINTEYCNLFSHRHCSTLYTTLRNGAHLRTNTKHRSPTISHIAFHTYSILHRIDSSRNHHDVSTTPQRINVSGFHRRLQTSFANLDVSYMRHLDLSIIVNPWHLDFSALPQVIRRNVLNSVACSSAQL